MKRCLDEGEEGGEESYGEEGSDAFCVGSIKGSACNLLCLWWDDVIRRRAGLSVCEVEWHSIVPICPVPLDRWNRHSFSVEDVGSKVGEIVSAGGDGAEQGNKADKEGDAWEEEE